MRPLPTIKPIRRLVLLRLLNGRIRVWVRHLRRLAQSRHVHTLHVGHEGDNAEGYGYRVAVKGRGISIGCGRVG
jgi:hypothetical protein